MLLISVPSSYLLLVVLPGAPFVASLFLVAMPAALVASCYACPVSVLGVWSNSCTLGVLF